MDVPECREPLGVVLEAAVETLLPFAAESKENFVKLLTGFDAALRALLDPADAFGWRMQIDSQAGIRHLTCCRSASWPQAPV